MFVSHTIMRLQNARCAFLFVCLLCCPVQPGGGVGVRGTISAVDLNRDRSAAMNAARRMIDELDGGDVNGEDGDNLPTCLNFKEMIGVL